MLQNWSHNNVKLASDERGVGPDRPTVQPAPTKPLTPKQAVPPPRLPEAPAPFSPAKPPAFTKAKVQGPDQSVNKPRAQSGGGRPSYSSPNGNEQEPMRTDANSRLPKNPLRSENRIDPGASDTCPHGMPYYKKCYICKPDDFDG
jgi:hypothetical protein